MATPRWGLADAALLWALQIVASVLWAGLLVGVFFGGVTPDPRPIGLLLGAQLAGWAMYGIGPFVITRQRGGGPREELRLRATVRDLTLGMAGGAGLQLVAIPLLYWPIQQLVDDDPSDLARRLVERVDSPLEVVALTLLVAVGAPVFEELFYRGFVLRGAEHTLSRRTELTPVAVERTAVVVSATVFALVHIDPLLYPGTFLLGLVAGQTVIRTDRIGPALGLHLGFNLVTLVLLLAER